MGGRSLCRNCCQVEYGEEGGATDEVLEGVLTLKPVHLVGTAGAESAASTEADGLEPGVLLGRAARRPTPEHKPSTPSSAPGAHVSPLCSMEIRRLTTDISSDLLRAAPLHQVEEIDDFLSHDWGTSGTAKYLCLLVIYNSRLALVAGLFVGLLVPVLEVVVPKVVYYERRVWAATSPGEVRSDLWLVPLCTFWLVMLRGQSLLRALRRLSGCRRQLRARMAFLDKLCIDQVDAARKQAGILALGAFLKHSKRLVILFSPRYFTRIWCVHELATWCELDPDSDREIFFMPVSLGVALFLVCTAVTGGVLVFSYAQILPNLVCFVLLAVFLCLWTVVPVILLTMLGEDMRRIPDQLTSFDVRGAQCYCCSVGHAVPETGAPLPCDRRLIYESLEARFRDRRRDEVSDEWYLDLFNSFAREDFRRRVRVFADGTRIRYTYALPCVAGPVLMYMSCLHRITFMQDLHRVLAYVLFFFTYPFVSTMLSMKLSLLLCSRPRLCRGRFVAWMDFVINAAGVNALVAVTWAAAAVPCQMGYYVTQIVLSALMLLALVCLQWPGALGCSARGLSRFPTTESFR